MGDVAMELGPDPEENDPMKQLSEMDLPNADLLDFQVPYDYFMTNFDPMLDSVFDPASMLSFDDTPLPAPSSPIPNQVRIYTNDEHLLGAYYYFIHPYLPILPPPETNVLLCRPVFQRLPNIEPTNPLRLALSAILVLIPHPDEHVPSRPEYVSTRRDLAHCFASAALEAVENDYLLPQFVHNSNNGFTTAQETVFTRKPLHPKVPVYLEGVIALALLSMYEYAQRGSLQGMLHRTNQALKLAMKMSLHESLQDDEFAVARQRAWWVTYMTACQAFAASNAQPSFLLYDPRFVTPYPEGWELLVEAQQVIVEAVGFTRDVEEAVKSGGDDFSWVSNRMIILDREITSLLFYCRDLPSASQMFPPADAPEHIALDTMRAFAEIKLHCARAKVHRFCAFQELPLLSSDPPTTTTTTNASSDTDTLQSRTAALSNIPLASLSAQNTSTSTTPTPLTLGMQFPFSASTSTLICYGAVRSMITLLDNLPYPSPPGEMCVIAPSFLDLDAPTSMAPSEFPRGVPMMVCCAIQAIQTALMLAFKARMNESVPLARKSATSAIASASARASTAGLRSELEHAMTLVVKFLANPAIAFEALGGVKDEVAAAMQLELDR